MAQVTKVNGYLAIGVGVIAFLAYLSLTGKMTEFLGFVGLGAGAGAAYGASGMLSGEATLEELAPAALL